MYVYVYIYIYICSLLAGNAGTVGSEHILHNYGAVRLCGQCPRSARCAQILHIPRRAVTFVFHPPLYIIISYVNHIFLSGAHKFFIFRGVQLHPSFTLLEALITNGSVLHLILNDDPYRGRPLYVRVKDGSDEEGRIRMITCGADFYVADVKEDLSNFNGIYFFYFIFFFFSCGVGADFYMADVKEDLSYFNGEALQIIISYVTTNYYFLCQ